VPQCGHQEHHILASLCRSPAIPSARRLHNGPNAHVLPPASDSAPAVVPYSPPMTSLPLPGARASAAYTYSPAAEQQDPAGEHVRQQQQRTASQHHMANLDTSRFFQQQVWLHRPISLVQHKMNQRFAGGKRKGGLAAAYTLVRQQHGYFSCMVPGCLRGAHGPDLLRTCRLIWRPAQMPGLGWT